MNIILLGATGNTGKHFVKLALERGHHLTAIVRNSDGLNESNQFEIVIGNVLNLMPLSHLFEHADAVVSCLGIRKADPSNPWSELLSPDSFTQQATLEILNVMQRSNVKRLITISSAGVGNSWALVDEKLQEVIQTSSIRRIFNDLERMESVMARSGLDTLAVRPVALVNREATGNAHLVNCFDTTSRITTGDVALWMLDAVERPDPFAHQTEMIGT